MASGIAINALLNQANPQQIITANGRQYLACYYKDRYPYPCDENEKERLDFLNIAIYSVALRHRPTRAPLKTPARVVDIGCGTGWWAFNLAFTNPDLEIIGLDLANIQPTPDVLPPNVKFHTPVDITQDDWHQPHESFHLVHQAMLYGAVGNWFRHYSLVYQYVVPEGYFELVEIDWCPRCSAPPDPEDRSVFDEWYSGMVEASEEIGLPIAYRGDTDIMLRRAGFEVEEHLTIPLVCCCGPREKYSPNEDSDTFKMADDMMSWMRSAMGVDGMGDWPGRWSGFMMELFTRFKGYSQAEVEALDRRLCHAVQRPNCPFYFDLHIWLAKKPATSPSRGRSRATES